MAKKDTPKTSQNDDKRAYKKAKFARQIVDDKGTVSYSPVGNGEQDAELAEENTAAENITPEIKKGKNSGKTDKKAAPAGEEISTEKAENVTEEKDEPETETVDPETKKRFNKAAYIKQANERLLTMDRLKTPEQTEPEEFTETENNTAEQEEIPLTEEDNSEKEKDPLENSAGTNTAAKEQFKKKYAFNNYSAKREKARDNYSALDEISEYTGISENEAIKNAYEKEFAKNKLNIPVDGIMTAAIGTAEVISDIQSGDANKVLARPAKQFIERHLSDCTNKAVSRLGTVSGTVNNSDSVGGAAANIGTALAGNEVKKYVYDKLRGYSPEKTAAPKSVKKDRKIDAFKEKFSEKTAEIKRAIQKKIFIRHNKDNTSYAAKTTFAKSAAKKKGMKILIGGAAGVIVPILLLLIVLIAAMSLFSWVNPFKFSLAGDDSGTETEAKTEAEIIDANTLMIRNYMDVAQAEYYLEYGDWYGGTYEYPSAEEALTFSDFYSQKCQTIIQNIQNQYADALANARSAEEASAIAADMNRAISQALSNAMDGAQEEYLGIIEQLDDYMTAEENRQHYEVKDSGNSNGVKDADEFTGKPIVGTNNFGNVEIQSDLSSEELMAMMALYKSMKLAQTGGKSEDGTEYSYNITPEDIMTFFEETGYIKITTEITHDNFCDGNCKRRLVGNYEDGYSWEYYCDGDHDNLTGQIEPCISKDELLEKMIEITDGEENGFDKDQCEKMIDEYLKTINKELEITDSDYRQFGAKDNERANEFYELLIDPAKGEIPNNYWEIDTPFDGEESEENTE